MFSDAWRCGFGDSAYPGGGVVNAFEVEDEAGLPDVP